MKRSNLTQIGEKYGTDKATYHKFTDFYEAQLKDREIKSILEIGILGGASLRMWKEYCPDAVVIGLDVQQPLEIPNVICLKGDAGDPKFLAEQFREMKFDLIIDDGSHKTADQIAAFKQLFYNNLAADGVYICEDVHTSHRPEYVNSDQTMLEYIGSLVYTDILFKEFWRDPLDKTDSGTLLIRHR